MGLYIAIVALLILLPLAFAAASLAPWVPSRAVDLDRIEKLAGVKDGESVYELGAGNGRVSLYLARRYPNNAVVAIERAWPLALIIWMRTKFHRGHNAKVLWADLFKVSLVEAGVVYVFGMPDPLKLRLKGKLEQELRPGAKVLSYAFPITGLEPASVDTAPGRATIYVYQL